MIEEFESFCYYTAGCSYTSIECRNAVTMKDLIMYDLRVMYSCI